MDSSSEQPSSSALDPSTRKWLNMDFPAENEYLKHQKGNSPDDEQRYILASILKQGEAIADI